MDLEKTDPTPGTKQLKPKQDEVGHKEDATVGKNGPRKRVSQACDRCRSRKDKCDGKKPTCTTCLTNRRTCSYDANVKKRGLPEGYVRGLEKLWGLAIREVEGVEDTILLVLTSEEGNETLLSVWNEDGPSDSLVETWRKSKISQELERLLPILEPSGDAAKRKRVDSESQAGKRPDLSSTQSQSAVAVNYTATSEVTSKSWHNRKIDAQSQNGSLRSPITAGDGDQVTSGKPTKTTASLPDIASAEYRTPDLPSDTWQLLDVYYSYTHCWFPIIEKHDLLRTSYQYSQHQATKDASSLKSGDYAALWAAVSYAKYQHATANIAQGTATSPEDAKSNAKTAYSHARSLIPNEEEIFQLGHVQALLILTLTNMGLGYFSRAWLLVGQAVRIAMDMGLDCPVYSGLDTSRSSLRSRHVFQGCFALDTILAARLGRRPHLRSEDSNHVGLLNEDGLEEWDPWTDCLGARKNNPGGSRGPVSILSTFNRLIQVLQILNDAICSVSSGTKRKQLTTELSTSLLERLRSWRQSQPPHFSFDTAAMNNGSIPPLLPHQYHLHLAYVSTLSTLQLLSYRHKQEGTNFEHCATTARQFADLLKHHTDAYEMLIVPPTFEYFIKTAYDTVHEVQSSIESTHIILDDWKYNMDSCIEAMEDSWPAFKLFRSSPSYLPVSKGRRESQVAYELISGLTHEADTPRSVKTPQTTASFEVVDSYTPHAFRSQPLTGVERPQVQNIPQKIMAPPISQQQRSSSFTSSPSNLRPNLQQAPEAAFNIPVPLQNDAWSMNNQRQQLPLTDQTSMNMSQPFPSQFQHAMSINSDVESDSMFNEFAALDAIEWTDNWDQSLVNLGFTDPDKMNQDFYAMSREPDSVYPNTVFQQLLANSNSESSNLLHGSGFGGVNMQGFGGFADGSEGIEAGQILQALSQAEDRGRLSRGNG